MPDSRFPENRSLRLGGRALLATLCVFIVATPLAGMPFEQPNAAELELALERLQVLGSVLHVGAHPDDENTALLAYLARGRKLRAAYLSVTRGDGGQNLIGSEKGELLGLIRTQELLAARRRDGAEQLFTRAIDYGYSKSADEAFRNWGEEEVLGDVVWAFRRFRPDVVITRFPGDGRGGHGHHTASALLAERAFEAAGDPSRFPEQLEHVSPWQPKRLVWNYFGRGFSQEREDDSGLLAVDVGTYDPLLGRSYTEIAATGRSMHKSQGFGSTPRRGQREALFEHRAGDLADTDLLDGVTTDWRRIPGGEPVGQAIAGAIAALRGGGPAAAVPSLLAAWDHLEILPATDPWVAIKRADLADAIRAAAGLRLEALAEAPQVADGSTLSVTLAALLRTPGIEGQLLASAVTFGGGPATGGPLETNVPLAREASLTVPTGTAPSAPYWLAEEPEGGRFTVGDPLMVGLPESPAPLVASFEVELGGRVLRFEEEVLFRWTDPVAGESYRRVQIVPQLSLGLERSAFVFADGEAREVRVTARAGRTDVRGEVRLELPPGWRAEPEGQIIEIAEQGGQVDAHFTVTPPAQASDGLLRARASVGDRSYGTGLVTIEHPHIPIQTLFPKSEARAVRLGLDRRGQRIGYVEGAGDEIPAALAQLGYEVQLLTDADLGSVDLAEFDAIVLGIRAVNTRPRLRDVQPRLFSYVEQGGTLVAQYNTFPRGGGRDGWGPYPFEISRGRVTVEGAPMKMLLPDHPLLSEPNRIGPEDFEGWVQERGLYFPGTWDEAYQTPLASADPGEDELAGGLLYARLGSGVFIYTGYSFFRQLPAGVPGAYRLFVNLISARVSAD